MRVLLRPNFDKPGSVVCTRAALRQLIRLDIVPMLDPEDARVAGPVDGCVIGRFEELLPDCDLVLTIGGDGTILHAVQFCLPHKKPLLGINTGRIGFLTQLEADELEHLALLRGDYALSERMLLEVSLVSPSGTAVYTALNDVVINRGDMDRLVEIDITSGSSRVARHRADGMIFATPTGSTAYSLAAGGSIVHPSLTLITMTAICPHSHFNHSIVLAPDREYAVRELPGRQDDPGLYVSVDGRRVGRLRNDCEIRIRQSPQKAVFIDLNLRDFFSCVDQKLALGGRL